MKPASYRAIALVLAIVVLSYTRTVRAYETSGGAYVVAKDNLGTLPSLVAGAALLVDYVLTVAVSVTAGVLALTSAAPSLASSSVSPGSSVPARTGSQTGVAYRILAVYCRRQNTYCGRADTYCDGTGLVLRWYCDVLYEARRAADQEGTASSLGSTAPGRRMLVRIRPNWTAAVGVGVAPGGPGRGTSSGGDTLHAGKLRHYAERIGQAGQADEHDCTPWRAAQVAVWP